MRPTRRTVQFGTALLLLSLAAPFAPLLFKIWLGAMGVFFLLLVADAWRLWRLPLPVVTRKLDHTLALGTWKPVSLRIENPGRRPVSVIAHDFHPGTIQAKGLPLHMGLAASGWSESAYKIRPVERGSFYFKDCQLLLSSPGRFWFRSLRSGGENEVRVYPNFQAMAKFTFLSTKQRLGQIGIHRRRKRGEGREFHQMREFVQGDPLRQIDWKTTSRMRKLISREYHDERDQQVVFLMDCGQSMRAQDGDLSHFDHALNSVLLMSNVALRHGDAVGMMTFGGVHRWLAARKGLGQLNLMLNTVYDIQPTLHTSDFLSLARQALAHIKKRSLLVLLTNLKDEDHQELGPAMRLLRRKHLVLLASMRERVLDDVTEGAVESFEDALRIAATYDYLKQRRRAYEILKNQGTLCLDVVPDLLHVQMINSYLDIKGRGLL